MNTFKTVQSDSKIICADGTLKLLSERDGLKQKVELWLLNNKVNRNNWRYVNLAEHKDLFAETPLLIAYVDGKIGDGHNFDEVIDANGNVTASFMSATAERIVGYIPTKADVSMVNADGTDWIVATGYIWTWYAQELVKHLKRTGSAESDKSYEMSVSIETLVDEMHYDGTTEVFTKYRILGTTILHEDVAPAVAGANIKALSAIGVDEVKKMTIRVASLNTKQQKASNPQTINKGVINSMNINDVAAKFDGCTVLALNGETVVLTDEAGNLYVSSASKENGQVVVGAKTDVASLVIRDNGAETEIKVSELIGSHLNKIAALEAELKDANDKKDAALVSLSAMQEAETKRRKETVREAIKSHFADVRANAGCDIAESACDELLKDEKIDEYAEMVDANGEFCGNSAAIGDVDRICMAHILTANKAKNNSVKSFAWDVDAKLAKPTGIEAIVASTMK